MPKYRIRFAREDEARFVAHLDILRTFERSVRRSGESMTLTKGFNPHPKISFAAPAPVGLTALDEYVDIELNKPVSVEEFTNRLNSVLPPGIRIKQMKLIPDRTPSLMSMLKSATYQVTLRLLDPLSEHELNRDIESLLESEEVNVTRTKKGVKSIVNIRRGILKLTGQLGKDNKILLKMHLQAGSSGNVRPMEVLDSFIARYGYRIEDGTENVVRTGLYARGENGYTSMWKC